MLVRRRVRGEGEVEGKNDEAICGRTFDRV